jgi:hypothetical protein
MLQRLVAGTAIASLVIAVGAFVVLLLPGLKASSLTTIWCFVPLLWGVWAMCAPSNWVPRRLPMWGAILGLIAGWFAAFVVNVPLRLLGVELPTGVRVLVVFVAALLYYLLWMLVRALYRAIAAEPARAKAASAAGVK